MTRKILFASGEHYHVYNRGTDKRDIFLSDRDYGRFLALLFICNSSKPVDLKLQGRTLYEILENDRGETIVDLLSYCLMPNHFHLIIHEKNEGGISHFMQKLMTGYTMYFNKLNERSGALFQGKFKATHIDNDRYLSYLISYVHLNPIKLIDPDWKTKGLRDQSEAEKFLNAYRYSSFKDYCKENRLECALIDKIDNPLYHDNWEFRKHVTEWLEYPLQGSTL